MPVTVHETFNSRKPTGGANPTDELLYLLQSTGAETDDDVALKAALAAEVPATWRGLVLDTFGVGEQKGSGWWEGYARYKSSESSPREVGDVAVSFDTTGGTEHYQIAKEPNTSYAMEGVGTGPNTGSLIGVTEDSVEGVDVVVPVFKLQETWTFDDSDITPTYVDTLFRMSTLR